MRRSVYVENFSHGNNPIPAASVVGNIMVTGAVYGSDPANGEVPPSAEEQCEFMFENVRRILEAGGASLGGVLKMTFYIRSTVSRDILNKHWVVAFPDAESRPARHVMVNDNIPARQAVQCDVLAVLGN